MKAIQAALGRDLPVLVSWLRTPCSNSRRLGKLKHAPPEARDLTGGAYFSLPGAAASQYAPAYTADFRNRKLVTVAANALVDLAMPRTTEESA
jgi:hypothetical protein